MAQPIVPALQLSQSSQSNPVQTNVPSTPILRLVKVDISVRKVNLTQGQSELFSLPHACMQSQVHLKKGLFPVPRLCGCKGHDGRTQSVLFFFAKEANPAQGNLLATNQLRRVLLNRSRAHGFAINRDQS